MKSLLGVVLILALAGLLIPPATALAQTATPTPTPTPDTRALIEVGMVQLMAGSPPDSSTGWLVCDGSEVSRSTYALLFSVIGVTYGEGDGSTTFNLPDLRGRVPMGAGTGVDGTVLEDPLTPRTLGELVGEEGHRQTVLEMALHSHTITDPGHSHTAGTNNNFLGQKAGGVAGVNNGTTYALTTTTGTSFTGITNTNIAGAGDPANVVQPSTVLNFLIWSGTVPLSIGLNPDADIVVTVVVVFPTHTSTPTPTPTLTPTSGPSPTPTATPTPTGVSPYEAVTSINGQPVLFEYRVRPGDAAIFGITFVAVGLIIYALWTNIKRRRG